MILVNLLPHDLRPVKRTPLPHIVSLLVLLGVLSTIAVLMLASMGELSDKKEELETVKNELGQLKDTVEKYNELATLKEGLQSKIGVIQEILQDRTIWSEELNRLAHLTPDNIWYSSITVTNKRSFEWVQEPDPKDKKKMKRVKKSIMRPVLEVSGYAIDDEDGIKSVTPLTERTSDDPIFSSKFELLPATTSDTLFEGYPVRSFTMQYWINPSTAQQETPR